MHRTTKQIVADFIETIWNQQQFDNLEEFLHAEYVDHSLPPAFATNQQGLQQWIKATSQSFVHHTHIEEQVTEGDKTMLKINMHLHHVGSWRNIVPTGKKVSVTGYRFYRIANQKIIEHWGLIDGNAIENQLRDTIHGCKIQE